MLVIFYQPKDIVSGDFYFVEQVTTSSGEEVSIFAAVDCTGHRFTGAFMSFLIITSPERKKDFDFEHKDIKGPLFNSDKSFMLVEIKGDKHPIGLYGEYSKSFTNQEYPIQKGDVIYAYSDGYIDQFGGEHFADIKKGGKKFGTKRFKDFILSIADLPMDEQKEKLIKTFVDWKGDLENLDDVLVMGVRVK